MNKVVLLPVLSIFYYGLILTATYAAVPTNRPRGIFVAVDLIVPSRLVEWLDKICTKNKQLPASQRMDDLVISDIGIINSNGATYNLNRQILDIIVKYVPGGSKSCFSNLFVGPAVLKWNGPGNPYNTGILDADFRRRNVEVNRDLANQFVLAYPQVRIVNWYIVYEANLEYLLGKDILAAYEDLLKNLIRALQAISSGAVMWSPAMWPTWNDFQEPNRSNLKVNLNRLFTNLKSSAPPGINWMNLQDSVGKATNSCTGLKTTPWDAVQFYHLVKESFTFASMQLNEELFEYTEDCKGMRPSSPETQIQRENFYGAYGVRLGAAFEIRYWRFD